MSLPKEVHIQECCPRDGWQNHAEFIPTDVKIKYIRRMIDCGAKELEVTSFVNPKVMPQMADAAAVFEAIKPYAAEKGCTLSTLALNKRGADAAVAAGSHMLSFVVSASEEHNLRNSRRTIQESMAQFKELASQQTGDVRIQLALPCVFGSPFGDEIPLERLDWIVEEAHSVGVEYFGLADTSGISTPTHTREVLRHMIGLVGADHICAHLHDTHGMGIANAFVALEEGVTHFDASLAAMGGCPFAPGAKGNIATEDLVNMCEKMGIHTGYNLEMLTQTARDMCEEIHAHLGGSMALACHG